MTAPAPSRAPSGRRAPTPVRRALGAAAVGVRRVRNLTVEARSGQRPLVVVLVVALVLGVIMVSGPFERYLDGRDRVAGLQGTADALDDEIAALEERATALEDPLTLESLAREQQGMIRPGEVPYTLVPPEVDRPRIGVGRDEVEPDGAPWYARAWNTVRGWF